MHNNLLEFTSSFKDPRRGQGQRHKLHDVLTIIIMAIISGHQSIKGFARFAKSNEEELSEYLGLKHGVPSFNTFRSVLESLDEQVLSSKFIDWATKHHVDWSDDFIALDGKSIKSSVGGGNTEHQNFISVVSAFGQKSKMVYGMKSLENKNADEPETARKLMEELKCVSKTFTLDALHAKKNS